MHIVSATYERELKGILTGDPRVLAGMSKSLDPTESARYAEAQSNPFLVVRAAGSLGADLVALRHDVSFLVEVKSSKEELLHFTDSPRLTEQVDLIRSQCERSGVLPFYAFRLKGIRGDAWRLFTLPGLRLAGRARLLYDQVPRMDRTTRGNPVLRWQEGMPLATFLAYVNRSRAAAALPTAALAPETLPGVA